MTALPLTALALAALFLSGCYTPPAQPPEPVHRSSCPEPLVQQQTVILTAGQNHIAVPDGWMADGRYADFVWIGHAPFRLHVATEVTWADHLLALPQAWVIVRGEDSRYEHGSAQGPSPVRINFTLAEPPNDVLRVLVYPGPNNAVLVAEEPVRISVVQQYECTRARS